MKNENSKIACSAENCIYNCGNKVCTAGKIEVGNSSACCCGETQCSTFKMSEDGSKDNGKCNCGCQF